MRVSQCGGFDLYFDYHRYQDMIDFENRRKMPLLDRYDGSKFSLFQDRSKFFLDLSPKPLQYTSKMRSAMSSAKTKGIIIGLVQ